MQFCPAFFMQTENGFVGGAFGFIGTCPRNSLTRP
jgi:hypothetical protein